MQINTDIIRKRMKQLDFNQSQLAKEIGLKRQGVLYILRKKSTSLETFNKISQVLGIDPKELLIQ